MGAKDVPGVAVVPEAAVVPGASVADGSGPPPQAVRATASTAVAAEIRTVRGVMPVRR
jgi:hypothetical protein